MRMGIIMSLVLGALVFPAGATPANKAAMARHYGGMLAKGVDRCATCHLPSENKSPESLAEFPHNAFGDRLKVLGERLEKEGKDRSISSRLALVAAEDADADGVANELELLLGSGPGDATEKPADAMLKDANEKVAAFEKISKGYRWRPFEAVTRPTIPAVKNSSWMRNPIDAFVAAEHEARGLEARPEAGKTTLLRRLYIDLIGLNPTPAEILAYELDASADAYERVVEKLLADPRYGQRWGRHWMDVWRYSDWAGWGEQVRDSQPHIWRWRDWIVESLNAGKGYDRMVMEMLAADEISPEDEGALRATGFLARNYKRLSREQWLEDTVNHTSRAFLGLTVHCAKCHNHFFDPVSQAEYYEFRAIFEPHNVRIDHVPGGTDIKKDGLARIFDARPQEPTYFFARGDERKAEKDRVIAPAVPRVLGSKLEIAPVSLPTSAIDPENREFVIKDLIAASEKAMAEAQVARAKETARPAAAGAEKRVEVLSSSAVAEARHAALLALLKVEEIEAAGKHASEQWVAAAQGAVSAQRQLALLEASHNLIVTQHAAGAAKGAQADAARKKVADAEAALAKAAVDLTAAPSTGYKSRNTTKYPQTSTGRRLALAKWIVDPRNPLAARVAANHIWLRHFGQGIVSSPADFGANGRPPSHPALLDYLASELMSNGWSMKHLHRQIVTSATYRMASTADERSLAKDPDNVYLWRSPSRRLEAEAVRDNVLHAAGQLDISMGGPEIDQKLALISNRRSIYLRIAAEKEAEFLKIFDGPSMTECYQRGTSVVPHQALALANSQLVLEKAKVLAKTLMGECCEDDSLFVTTACLRVLSRRPSPEESKECLEFLRAQKNTERAYENLIVVLFNHNDFVTAR